MHDARHNKIFRNDGVKTRFRSLTLPVMHCWLSSYKCLVVEVEEEVEIEPIILISEIAR
jgi:hypothetical protein